MKNLTSLLFIILIISSCSSVPKTSNNTVKSNQITLSNGVIIKGGDGSSYKKAKIIIAKNSTIGIRSEYEYLEKTYGKRGVDWMFIQQSLNYIDQSDVVKKMETRFTVLFHRDR